MERQATSPAGGGRQMSPFAEFASWLRAGNLSEGTIALRIHHLRRFCRDHDLDTATPETVIKWLENPGWKPATKLSARASLKSYYRWAMESGRLDADPTAKTRTIKMPPRAIKEAPQDALLTALEGAHERDRLAIMLAAYARIQTLIDLERQKIARPFILRVARPDAPSARLKALTIVPVRSKASMNC